MFSFMKKGLNYAGRSFARTSLRLSTTAALSAGASYSARNRVLRSFHAWNPLGRILAENAGTFSGNQVWEHAWAIGYASDAMVDWISTQNQERYSLQDHYIVEDKEDEDGFSLLIRDNDEEAFSFIVKEETQEENHQTLLRQVHDYGAKRLMQQVGGVIGMRATHMLLDYGTDAAVVLLVGALPQNVVAYAIYQGGKILFIDAVSHEGRRLGAQLGYDHGDTVIPSAMRATKAAGSNALYHGRNIYQFFKPAPVSSLETQRVSEKDLTEDPVLVSIEAPQRPLSMQQG